MITPEEALSLFDEVVNEELARPRPLTERQIEAELKKCKADLIYFIKTYCQIYDNISTQWIPFKLWPAQEETLRVTADSKYVLVPKARQNGLSWLLGDARPLWRMIFWPIREALLFSQRDDEAMKLLQRLHGTYDRLPDWMKPGISIDSAHEFQLINGSRAQALPASAGGRSNAATDVIIDEADFVDNLATLVSNARPTIDAGAGQMTILSTINEDIPNSYFQQLCRMTAENDDSVWTLFFLGWSANPNRTQDWHDKLERETLLTFGTLDSMYKHYPANLTEALAPRELNKRFPPSWIVALSQARKPLALELAPDAPALPGLRIYKTPTPGRVYGIGADPGGGKVDTSAAQVIDDETGEQVACLGGLVEPTQFANQVADLSLYYFNAPVLFELNNHGHAFLSQSKERGVSLRRGVGRRGVTDREPGWMTSERSKHNLYDIGAKVMQQAMVDAAQTNGVPTPILFDQQTISELASIDVGDLVAPEGQHDDYAMAWVLAQMCVYRGNPSMQQVAYTGLWGKGGAESANQPLSSASPIKTPGLPVRAALPQRPESPAELSLRLRSRKMTR